jgi:hypothetical protein
MSIKSIIEKGEHAQNKQPVCNNCKNYIKGLECKAFARIPDEILFNANNHNKPLKDQANDIIFEPIN